MKRRVVVGCLSLLIVGSVAQARTLKFPPAEKVAVESASPHAKTVGLLLPEEFVNFKHTEKTSPFDKLHYPVGTHSVDLLRVNLPQAFAKVVDSASRTPAEGVDFVVEPTIVSFDAVVPRPASKPYLATVVYRVDVYDKTGEKIFTQTATGEGQTSEGMKSGFKAGTQCVRATTMAASRAMKQLLEGLLAAEEIRGAATSAAP